MKRSPWTLLIHQLSTAPSVAVIDVEHHDCNVLVVVVVLLRLVHELCLHLDDAVKGLVGDQGLVPDVQLQEGCRPAPGTMSTSLCLYIAQLYTDGSLLPGFIQFGMKHSGP